MTDLSLSPTLMASIVNDAYLFTVVLRPDFSMAFVSKGIEARLGLDPAEITGRSVTEFVHPEDLERALLHLSGYERFGAPGGTGTFRLRHRDGSWLGFDVTAARVNTEDEELFAVYCTPVDYQQATNEVLARLLSGANRVEALEPVLDVISWQENDASVAICWTELDGNRVAVSTGLPPELTGEVTNHGDPWDKARRFAETVLSADQGDLDQQQRATAADFRRGGVWVVPAHSPSYPEPALITVWTRAGGPRPDGHAYGTEIAARYVELILRWTNQADLLAYAASRDPLTGLANRRRLFEQLETATSRGALLFCDLDHFKPVNDTHGHQAGDAVLKEVGRRIEASVRSTDLVARTGGDEFVVVAPDIDLETAAALAQRIRTEIAQPIDIGGASVQVGVTVGVAYAEDILSEAALSGADQALTNAKARDRGTVRWAPGPMPQAHLSASLAIEETQQPPIAQGFPGRSAGSVL
ncbi:MAG: sensor domain-containing diguanylate cyclase [Acidimicrobiales bacterium]|nr:sensor domain-containing diguanylate cyclase [Acidimicrobiales bacterium]